MSIISAAKKSDNLSLKVRDSVREVVATYSIDEGSMELVVALPSNYPLGGLNVESGKKVGVESGQPSGSLFLNVFHKVLSYSNLYWT